MNELKTLQEETVKEYEKLFGIQYPFESKETYFLNEVLEKSFTLGKMKGVELVEGVVPEIKARHELPVENSPEIYGDKRSVAWSIGHSICRSEILSNITKLKQELK